MNEDLLLLILLELRQIKRELSKQNTTIFNINTARDINVGEAGSCGKQKKEGSSP